MCYYSLKEYEKAILFFDRVIPTPGSADGKADFFKGLCLNLLGRKAGSCQSLQAALAKHYKDAAAVIAVYCK